MQLEKMVDLKSIYSLYVDINRHDYFSKDMSNSYLKLMENGITKLILSLIFHIISFHPAYSFAVLSFFFYCVTCFIRSEKAIDGQGTVGAETRGSIS